MLKYFFYNYHYSFFCNYGIILKSIFFLWIALAESWNMRGASHQSSHLDRYQLLVTCVSPVYIVVDKKLKKKLYGPFLWMGFNCLKATATSRRQFIFYHLVPRNFWYSFYQPRKDERLSQTWSHPVVLNLGPLDW